ncbi:carbohydrate ABC transporter permease [bacterium 1XD8-76]|nr:carbohydrate ABC transporter permease [bacterium 1XD8-76]
MKKRINTIILLLISGIHLIPFYILITMAFKEKADLSSKWVIPDYLYLGNFSDAWKSANLGRMFVNNVLITLIATFLIIILGAMAAYPLSRLKTKWNTFIYTSIVSCMIVPALTILVPLYKIMADMGGISKYWGIVAVHVTFMLPLSTFLYTGFIGTIPRELDEAALIDGKSRLGVFFSIIFPLLKPITATVIILCGINVWNDYQFSVFFLQKTDMRTIPVSLNSFFSMYQSQVNWMAAGCLTASLPLVVIFLILQKQFVKGLSSGAVKL